MKKIIYFSLMTTLLTLFMVGCAPQGTASPVSEHPLLPFLENDKVGFVNHEGEIIINPQFDGFRDIEYGVDLMNGMATVTYAGNSPVVLNFNVIKKDGYWGVIDDSENIIISIDYHDITFYDGEIIVLESERKYDIFDATGTVLMEQISDRAYIEFWENRSPSHSALIPQSKNGRFGYVDQDGNTTIDHKFHYASGFSDGLALVTENQDRQSGFGYINEAGEYAIEPKYQEARGFNEGLAAVKESGDSRFHYIDTNGEIIEALESDMKFSCIDGVIRTVDLQIGMTRYMTIEGEVIFEYDHLSPEIF